jgi:hypothetical protein
MLASGTDNSGGVVMLAADAVSGVGVVMITPPTLYGVEVGAALGVGAGVDVGGALGVGEAPAVGVNGGARVALANWLALGLRVALDGSSGTKVDATLAVAVGGEAGVVTTRTISVPWQPAVSVPAISRGRILRSLLIIVASSILRQLWRY